MSEERTFTVFGISTKKGKYNVRAANKIGYTKVLERDDHTDIRLVELNEELTKVEGAKRLLDLPQFQDEIAQAAIKDFINNVENKGTERATTRKSRKTTELDPVLAAAIAAAKRDKGETEAEVESNDDLEVDDSVLAMALKALNKKEEVSEPETVPEEEDMPY